MPDAKDVPAAVPIDPTRAKAIRFFTYLKELALLKIKTVREASAYQSIFAFSEIPREKECSTPAWFDKEPADDGKWLRIDKPKKPTQPTPPVACAHWFDPTSLDTLSPEPWLRDEIVDPNWRPREVTPDDDSEPPEPPCLRLVDYADLSAAWEDYLEKQWRPWSKNYIRWEKVQRVYRKLFAIYQEEQRRGEQYELLLGVGVLLWITPVGHRVNRPVVTAHVTIDLDRDTGCITITPAVDGAAFTLEHDMLEVDERPPINDQTEIARQVSELESPWDQITVPRILKGWVQTLPAQGDAEYSNSLEPPTNAKTTPRLAFAPLLMLRKRGTQTMREALIKIANQIEDGAELPAGIRAICGDRGPREESHGSVPYSSAILDEILFPLPANDQQGEIVRRLGRRPAVLVQGPPGTGKSHTIVNLISHFLAAGKRVLVTSQTPRALTVLRDKICKDLPEILPLVVSVLGQDSESLQNMEQSVQGILRRVNGSDDRDIETLICSLTRQRESAKAELAAARRQLREIREAEVAKFIVPSTSYHGTAQAMAKRHAEEAAGCAWIPDVVSEYQDAPLTDAEFAELGRLWEVCDFGLLNFSLPPLESIPTAESVSDAVRACELAERALIATGDSPSTDNAFLVTWEESKVVQMCVAAETFVRLYEDLRKRNSAWTERIWSDVCNGRGLMWTTLATATEKALGTLTEIAEFDNDTRLEVPSGIPRSQVSADAADLLLHLKSGRGLGFWMFRAETVKRSQYLWRASRFRGQRCNSAEVLEALVRFLNAEELLSRSWQEWATWLKAPSGTSTYRLTSLRYCCESLRRAIELGDFAASMLAMGVPSSGLDGPRSRTWGQGLLQGAKTAQATLAHEKAVAILAELAGRIEMKPDMANPHPVASDLEKAIATRDLTQYCKVLVRLSELHARA